MQNEPMMEIRLFAQARELANAPRLHIALPAPGTVGDLKRRIATEYPQLAELLDRCAVAVNRTYVPDDGPVEAGDEIAIIPPVAGG